MGIPSGTVTFLFTDIEGSTRLARQLGAEWPAAKACHHAILQRAIDAHGGYVFQIIGDAFCAAFATPCDAVAAALDAQHLLVGAIPAQQSPHGLAAAHAVDAPDAAAPARSLQPAGSPLPLRVRMGIHTGAAAAKPDGTYEGYLTLVRVQRIMSAAYGGQVLLSRDVADLISRDVPAGVSLRSLGMHRLKDMGAPEQLVQLGASGLRVDFPPLKTADHPNNLPAQLTSFIGREAELAVVRPLLAGTRLLTLTGAGGIGKSRLALQVAAEQLDSFPDGVWFAELAPLADPALIPGAIAAAIGVHEEPARPLLATLADHFRAKSALLVLDNCEHLLADAAQVCDTLLHAAPQLKFIATSREALGIAGEQAYRVPSLRLPDPWTSPDALPQVASVQLFVERARAAKADFALTRANASAVAQVCRRLDGIPLAVELAAARVRSMAVEQIAARLDDRFRILTGGSRTALPRQQTLRALIDWSYRLLSEPERVLLRRLSVFAGGWTLEAAEAICGSQRPAVTSQMSAAGNQSANAGGQAPGLAADDWRLATEDVLDLLSRLVDKSLVVVDTSEVAVRYRMLETIRQYAREMLDNSDEAVPLRDRHLAFFTQFAEAAGHIRHDPATQIPGITAELENLRAALTWAQDHHTDLGLRLIGAVALCLHLLGNSKEAYDGLAAFLARDTSGATSHRARALRAAGFLAVNIFHQDTQGWAYLQESIAVSRSLGDRLELAWVLATASTGLRHVNPEQAQADLDEALRLSQEINEPALVALVSNYFGEFWRFRGDDARARYYYERSLEGFHTVGRRAAALLVLLNLAAVALHDGDGCRAASLSKESLALTRETGVRFAAAYGLSGLGSAAALHHQPLVAARWFGAATAVLDQLRTSLEENDRADFDRYLALARSQAEPAAFDAAFAEGRAMSYDEALAFGLEAGEA